MKQDPKTATEKFYNDNAQNYFNRTIVIPMEKAYQKFLKYLKPGAKILDAGCGSGRDLSYFKQCGFSAIGLDASIEMVKLASKHVGQEILHLQFDEMTFQETFDGIWCSASLLHVPSCQIESVFNKIYRALKPNGVWFLSFKFGEFEGFLEERYFNHFTKERLSSELEKLENVEILEIAEENSYEADRNSKWIHCFVRKNHPALNNCIFCYKQRWISSQSFIEENEQAYAIFDSHPVNPGHILIISKSHYLDWFDAPRDIQVDMISLLEKMKVFLDKKYTPDGFNVGFNCGKFAGQTIPHLHIHLIPRYKGDCPTPEGGVRAVIYDRKNYLQHSYE